MNEESGTMTLNVIAIVIFLGLAAIAATVSFFAGRSVTGKWQSWPRLYLYALLGGLFAAAILFFGVKFEQVRAEDDLSSINTLLIMGCLLFLAMMIAWPLVGIALVHRKKRIRELEQEIAELKKTIG